MIFENWKAFADWISPEWVTVGVTFSSVLTAVIAIVISSRFAKMQQDTTDSNKIALDRQVALSSLPIRLDAERALLRMQNILINIIPMEWLVSKTGPAPSLVPLSDDEYKQLKEDQEFVWVATYLGGIYPAAFDIWKFSFVELEKTRKSSKEWSDEELLNFYERSCNYMWALVDIQKRSRQEYFKHMHIDSVVNATEILRKVYKE